LSSDDGSEEFEEDPVSNSPVTEKSEISPSDFTMASAVTEQQMGPEECHEK